jgi:hypothetical protein
MCYAKAIASHVHSFLGYQPFAVLQLTALEKSHLCYLKFFHPALVNLQKDI